MRALFISVSTLLLLCLSNSAPGLCGNNKVDVESEIVCPPCLRGRQCPCEKKSKALEQCDGPDLGGNSCRELGYIEGTLQCTRHCQLDESRCSSTHSKIDIRWSISLRGDHQSYSGLAIAATANGTAVAWLEHRGRDVTLHVFRFDATLSPLSGAILSDTDISVIKIAPSGNNWLIAANRKSPIETTIYALNSAASRPQEVARFRHEQTEGLFAGANNGPLLLLTSRLAGNTHSGIHRAFRGRILASVGRQLSAIFPVFDPVRTPASLEVDGRWLQGRWVIAQANTRARTTHIASVNSQGTVVALNRVQNNRIESNPRISADAAHKSYLIGNRENDSVQISLNAPGRTKRLAFAAPWHAAFEQGAIYLTRQRATFVRFRANSGIAEPLLGMRELLAFATAKSKEYILVAWIDGSNHRKKNLNIGRFKP